MIREAILAELDRRGWTKYRLVIESGVKADPVYKFLAGKRPCTTETIEPILRVLGLKIVNSH